MPRAPNLAFVRGDGTPGRVERQADVIRLGRPPRWHERTIVQVSRWDPLKDMRGVLLGFAELLERHSTCDVPHLVLAGPNVRAVADDPEGAAVFEDVYRVFHEQTPQVRAHAHLAMLPTADVEENATIVNALQRHAAIVVQKSLREGFGLTVTEAMWKARPVVASGVGGILDQIQDGVSGVLLADPTDLHAFAGALARVLDDPALAARLGSRARERARACCLSVGHLLQYADLLDRLEVGRARAA